MAATATTTAPTGWNLTHEETTYDAFVEMEYTRIVYTADDGTALRITIARTPATGSNFWMSIPVVHRPAEKALRSMKDAFDR